MQQHCLKKDGDKEVFFFVKVIFNGFPTMTILTHSQITSV